MTLAARQLSAVAFKPFGELVAADGHAATLVNEGRGQRYNTGVRLAHTTRANGPTLAIYRMQPSSPPISVNIFERHPNSAQLFLPMNAARYLIVVAPRSPSGGPDDNAACAFIGCADQGVIYAPGVWHAPLVALDAVSTFAMMMFENGDANDCIISLLNSPSAISL